ncbi:MAG TPA: hydrogen gas-evolving membrane-bound hydrogenase subunit E [Chthoniobacteraceae bacterium]|nr:hydrogen gas-evolving membrane-bound hydrogenase subunit E [Chthoniobacteraceae bacterium]
MDSLLLTAIFLPFVGIPLLAVLGRGERSGWWAFLFPLVSTACLVAVAIGTGGEPATLRYPWVPSLGVELTFLVDGLSLFFGLIVAGIGSLVFLYARAYLDGHYGGHGRFYASLLFFMGAMLGCVFAGNWLLLFVFWELTGVASFLLIGFFHELPVSRSGARMSLLVTSGTGLALLAGLLLVGQAVGSFDFATVAGADFAGASPFWLNTVALLVLLGAFGKSAQFPFQFWLPNAMTAPTPVSAYLHSATMVKLGLLLVARMAPVLQEATLWGPLLVLVGFATMVLGAVVAFLANDLKMILAYSTVSALGGLIGFYGLMERGEVSGDFVQILSHVFYKGCLFMVVGIVDQACHERDIRKLGGLRRRMPWVAAACAVAAASMAGMPGTLGFISKETLLETATALAGNGWGRYALGCTLVSAVLGVAFSLRFFLKVFCGPLTPATETIRPPSRVIRVSPLLLAAGTLVFGVFPGRLDALSAWRVAGLHAPEARHYALWHGWSAAVAISAAIWIAGFLLYRLGERLEWRFTGVPAALQWGRLFDRAMEGLIALCARITRATGAETPSHYLPIILAVIPLAVGTAVATQGTLPLPEWERPDLLRSVIALVIIASVCGAIFLKTWKSQLVSLSISGFLVSFYYLLYRAPDLALTQLFVETAVLVLVIFLLSRFARAAQRGEADDRPSPSRRGVNLAVSVLVGALAFASVAWVSGGSALPKLGPFYAANTVPLAGGTNAVNTILVDFRGFDTLGEISVLVIAMLSALGLLMRVRADAGRPPEPLPSGSREEPGQPPITSPILSQSSLALFGLINLLALYLLLRGHNAPGGGFIAGLCTAISLILLHLALGIGAVRAMFRFDPSRLAVAGLLLSLLMPTLSMFGGGWFFEHFAFHGHLPLLGEIHFGTAFFFDLGVYFVVVGIACKLIFTLASSTARFPLPREEVCRYAAEGETTIEPSSEGGASC